MKAVNWLDKYLEALFVGIGLVVMVAVMTAQIIYRRIFGNSIIWSEELCRHIFICSAFWGLSFSIRSGGAIKFDMIVTFFPERAKRVFEIISNVVVCLFLAYLLKPGWEVVLSVARISSTALPYNLDLVYGVSYAGIVLSGLRAMEMIVLDVLALLKGGKTEGRDEA